MTLSTAALQVTTQTLDAAPVEVVQSAPAAAPAAGGDLDMLQLVLHASLPVQIVMVILLLASIASWVIIIRKKKVLDRALREADDFEDRFWSGNELGKLYEGAFVQNQYSGTGKLYYPDGTLQHAGDDA